MLYSNTQRRCLELVHQFGSIRKADLAALLRNEFPQKSVNKAIDSLVNLNKIKHVSGIICLFYSEINIAMVEAINAMLQICDKPENIITGTNADLLRFCRSNNSGARQFRICHITYANEKSDDSTVVLLGTFEDRKTILAQNQMLAVKEADNYRFYKNEEE